MKKNMLKKIMIISSIICIIIVSIVALIPVIDKLISIEGQKILKSKIQNAGFLGILMLIGLQIAQIFFVIIPGEPIEILAGMCYGKIWGTLFIIITSSIISIIIFLLVRKFGKKFVHKFYNKKRVDKIADNKIFKDSKRIELILFILFLLPGTPKDLITYISGLLPIRIKSFIIISTFARIPSIISSTLAGESIINGNWKMAIILYSAIVLPIIILLYVINIFDKNRITEVALKSIK